MRLRDRAQRIRGVRRPRCKGIDIYIDSVALERAGIDPNGPVPYYRVWGAPGGRVVVNLYPEP